VVKLFRLNSGLCRLVTKSRDLALLLAGLSTKPSELPVSCGPVFRHKLKGTKRPQLTLGHGARETDTSPTAALDDERRWRSAFDQSRSDVLTGTIGARRAWTVSMISALSMPCR
jgi:hypothetical protein